MAITIETTTAVVAGSGLAATKGQLQYVGISTGLYNHRIVQQGPLVHTINQPQMSGIETRSFVDQVGGAIQDTNIVSPTVYGSTSSGGIVVFPKDFSRSISVFGVIGVASGVEQQFDRSPFFFSPHETDPNTMRDISEAQQFLMFSTIGISSYSIFTNTIGTAPIVTAKGDEYSDEALTPTNMFTHGNFEQRFSGWTVVATGSDNIEAVSEQPAGAIYLTPGCCPPPQGQWMAWADLNGSNGSYIKTGGSLGQSVSASAIKDFSVKVASGVVQSNRPLCFVVQFFEYTSDEPVYQILFRISNMGCDISDPAYDDLNLSPDRTIILNSILADQFNTLTTRVNTYLEQESFTFSRASLYVLFGTIDNWPNDILLDDIQLTVELPAPQLLKTAGTAHINTAHPVPSGYGVWTIPLTISGTEDIYQVDQLPPYFDETSPFSGTSYVPEDSELQFHVKDISSALDQGSINVYVDELQVVSAGATVTGSTWPIAFKTILAPNNIEYIFRRGTTFTPGTTVTVSGEFSDQATITNSATSVYQFTLVGAGGLPATITGSPDAIPPVITPTEPINGATQVSPNSEVQWSLTDDASGVDPETVTLSLDGVVVLEDDSAVEGSFYRVANTSRGYDYRYLPENPFGFGTTVTGTVVAADIDGNSDNLTYEFTITPADTLEIQNFFLSLNESTPLTTGTLMSVEVVDETYGVASGTTTFTVNGEVPSGLLTTYSGAGPDRIIFAVPLEPLVDFREDLTVVVHAENQFPGTFPVIKEEQYTLRPGYSVSWPNVVSGGPESVFPYVTTIQVLAEVNNYALSCGTGSAFFWFRTEPQAKADLGATIISNIQTADLPADLTVLNPFFEYGKTMVLEIEADDLEGNQFRLTHVFVIEQRP